MHGKKPVKSCKLSSRASLPVISRKGYGWRKPSLARAFCMKKNQIMVLIFVLFLFTYFIPKVYADVNNPVVAKPSCPEPPKPYELYASLQGDCATQWASYRDYLVQQQKTAAATLSARPSPAVYSHTSTTSTSIPTITSNPAIKQPTQTQKQKVPSNSLFQNIQKFFETITGFIKNIVGRR